MNYKKLVDELEKRYIAASFSETAFKAVVSSLIAACSIKNKHDLALLADLRQMLRNLKELNGMRNTVDFLEEEIKRLKENKQ